MITRPDGRVPHLAHGQIYLRPHERSDVPLFVEWFADARTSRTLGMRMPVSTQMEEAWYESMTADQGKTRYGFTACLLADDRPVGSIGLFDLDLIDGTAAMGLSVGSEGDRGHGYGTDMILALLAFGFEQLRLEHIWLEAFEYNPDARRLYERIGFVHEGTFRSRRFADGRRWDEFHYSMLAAEWRARSASEVDR